MDNPWTSLPKSKPYVLANEVKSLATFNRENRNMLPLDRIPEPYMGNPFTCKAVLLNLNPGLKLEDELLHNENEVFRSLSFANLLHEILDHPFYLLDPRLGGTRGNKWWTSALKHLIKEVGLNNVSQKLCNFLMGQ